MLEYEPYWVMAAARSTTTTSFAESVWSKLKGEDDDWTTDEVLVVLHWLRQVLGIAAGITLGVTGVVGSGGNLGYLAVSSFIVFVFYSSYMRIDEEYHGGHVKLLFEGLAPSYALMLLIWTLIHSSSSM